MSKLNKRKFSPATRKKHPKKKNHLLQEEPHAAINPATAALNVPTIYSAAPTMTFAWTTQLVELGVLTVMPAKETSYLSLKTTRAVKTQKSLP